MATVKEKVDTLENVLNQFILHTDTSVRTLHNEMITFKNEMKVFKDEMKVFKDEMKVFKDEVREEHRERNRQWAAMAKKMGTIDEDLVAPAVRPAVRKYFQLDPSLMTIRLLKRLSGEDYEVDVLAVAEEVVFMIEVKSAPKASDVDALIEKSSRFYNFFPEYSGKQLVPILASIIFADEIVKYATRKGIYVLAYREWEYMDILNFDEVSKRR